MPTFRRYCAPFARTFVASFVICTLLVALLAPALRPLLARAEFTEVCSAAGMRLVRLDGTPAPPKKMAGDHCLSCCVHQSPALAGRVAPPGMATPRVAFAERALAVPAFPSAAPDAAWPRGPPHPML